MLIEYIKCYTVTDKTKRGKQLTRIRADSFSISIDGSSDTIQQYLREGLIDELYIALSPVALGRGKCLFDGINLKNRGANSTGKCPRRKPPM